MVNNCHYANAKEAILLQYVAIKAARTDSLATACYALDKSIGMKIKLKQRRKLR